MPRHRILIVDDAASVRRIVATALGDDPEIEVVGSASNGRLALERIPDARPDLVVLDLEMPEMDGFQTLAEIRIRHPGLPVVIFSSFTRPGMAATLDALWLGASDYVTKPDAASATTAVRHVREELLPRVKALCEARARGEASSSAAPPAAGPRPTPSRISRRGVEVVAIGSSTGGPRALATLLAGLPGDMPVPVLIVQHMPPGFTRYLAERLHARSPLPVDEAVAGVELRPGRVWVAPGDHHLAVEREAGTVRLLLLSDPPENSCRPSADVLFRSVAAAYGPGALAVVLTGMGQDGLRGCGEVRAAGGHVLVQDEASSVVWGMPGCVARAGLADAQLPIEALAGEIARRSAAPPRRDSRVA